MVGTCIWTTLCTVGWVKYWTVLKSKWEIILNSVQEVKSQGPGVTLILNERTALAFYWYGITALSPQPNTTTPPLSSLLRPPHPKSTALVFHSSARTISRPHPQTSVMLLSHIFSPSPLVCPVLCLYNTCLPALYILCPEMNCYNLFDCNRIPVWDSTGNACQVISRHFWSLLTVKPSSPVVVNTPGCQPER